VLESLHRVFIRPIKVLKVHSRWEGKKNGTWFLGFFFILNPREEGEKVIRRRSFCSVPKQNSCFIEEE